MDVKKAAIIGGGSMGSMMALLLAEHGLHVTIEDPSEESRKLALENAKQAGFQKQVTIAKDYEEICANLDSPKIIIFSLPHGKIGDTVLEQLGPYLEKGDFVLDASNEHWLRTQRRQGEMASKGCHFIGIGVSGGYQSARSGPSLCPGGEAVALEMIMPLLKTIAAKDNQGNPCVANIGAGGAGHYTKMIHNGIEQGMMSGLCEIWAIMHHGLGMSYKEISEVFERWLSKGELSDNFLLEIGIDVCTTVDPEDGKPVLAKVKDKVVQDADESEGTGYWTIETAADLHVPIPTIAAAHNLRLGSSDAQQRADFNAAVGGPLACGTQLKPAHQDEFIEQLRLATYGMFLASFVQGLNVLGAADRKNRWAINFPAVIQIWRNGCIIRSGYLSDLLAPLYERDSNANLTTLREVAHEFKKTYPALKSVVMQATEADMVLPTLSATLEYLKYSTIKEDLPTQFQEAELDYFGKHMFDLRSDPPGKPVTGQHHFEWKPPKGLGGNHQKAHL